MAASDAKAELDKHTTITKKLADVVAESKSWTAEGMDKVNADLEHLAEQYQESKAALESILEVLKQVQEEAKVERLKVVRQANAQKSRRKKEAKKERSLAIHYLWVSCAG